MPENTATSLHCPTCGAPLEYDGSSAVVRCRFCKNITLIPGLPAGQESSARASLEEVRRLAQAGNLVDAINRYRQLYDSSLHEAKDAVEALAAGKVVEVHRAYSGPLNAEETYRLLEEVKDLLSSGDRIKAIQHYLEVNDVSLAQASEVVGQIEAGLKGMPLSHQQEIFGQPSTAPRPVKRRMVAALVTVLSIVVTTVGILVFVLSGRGNPFAAHLIASDPSILVSTGPGTPPDVASLFYNADADTRMVGLLDGSNGKLRWQATPLAGDGFAEAIAADDSQVYVASGTSLLAYNRTDGSQAWQAEMPDKINYGNLTLLVTGQRVLTANVDQSIQAYDSSSGSLVWSRQLSGYDRTLHMMGDSLVVIDTTTDTYTYSLIFLDPVDGSQQRIITPMCQYDQFSSTNLDPDSGLIYVEAENALYLVYDSSNGCVQRLDFSSGQMTWETVMEEGFSFSADGFNQLMSGETFYFNNTNQLVRVDKNSGDATTLLTNPDYDFIPLAIMGEELLVRAKRTRGTERFELRTVNAITGKQVWQLDLQGAAPVDPPDEMIGLVDETKTGWTWRLTPAGLVVVKFLGNPNQIVLDGINPQDGSLLAEKKAVLKQVSGDFYTIPTVIGWQENLVYLNLDSNLLALDITTGEMIFSY